MKITFVFPDLNVFSECSGDYSGIFAHGIGYLSSALKRNGHNTSLIHIVKEADRNDFLARVGKEQPDLVAFTSLSHQFTYVRKLSSWLKETHNIATICGGVHATIDPEEVIEADGVDMLCRGEGEHALVELCNKLSKDEDVSQIKNIWLKKEGKIIKNDIRPLEGNLDDLSFPDRSLFSYNTLYDYKIRMLTVLASRGCPYNCSYCCNHQYQKLYPHNYTRFRSVDNVLAEIREALGWYSDVEFVNFIDDALCLNRQWMEEFCAKFPKCFRFPFHGNSRVNLLDEEMMKLLKKGRCERLDVGIESGNVYIREKVLNRKISNKEITNVFTLAKKYNIKIATYNMVGCPFETPQMLLETIKLNAKLSPFAVNRSILQPYPNTDIYRMCAENNFIVEKEVSSFYKQSILEQPQLSRQQVVFFHRYFLILLKFYKFSNALPSSLAQYFTALFDKLAICASKSRLAIASHFLFFAIFSPINAMKQLLIRINPQLARDLKRLFFGRYYMRGKFI
ncbi:MAG: radical SAM protein [Candidatus Omnitrophota bacterium]|nr:radical SAM protein [Candidatus Omnitrophota bacterium]